MQFYIVIN